MVASTSAVRSIISLALLCDSIDSYQTTRQQLHPRKSIAALFSSDASNVSNETPTTSKIHSRRAFASGLVTASLLGGGTILATAPPAHAAIDVSGLRSDGGGGNAALRDQLKAYDGSGATRVQEIKSLSSTDRGSSTLPMSSSMKPSADALPDDSPAATYAYRYAPGFGPRLTKLGLGDRFRCDDQIVSPTGKGYLQVSFEFPSDWLQLDKLLGGVQYVDQRNGDKMYLLRAKLPADATLATVPKQFFGTSLFDAQGTIVRSGVNIDDYKVKSSEILSDGSVSAAHRRLLVKYATVTGNGLRTERRALVDAYEVDGTAYMLMTSSNAVKFEAQGRERETVENIVNSFRLEKVM